MAVRAFLPSLLLFGMQAVASNFPDIPAYNEQDTTILSNGDGPILGYKGSQGVPPIGTNSPLPAALPALRYIFTRPASISG